MINFPIADRRLTIARVFMSELIGIFHVEWAVLPPLRSIAAIPVDAVATAIFEFIRTEANKRLNKNVFPVPPNVESREKHLM